MTAKQEHMGSRACKPRTWLLQGADTRPERQFAVLSLMHRAEPGVKLDSADTGMDRKTLCGHQLSSRAIHH